MLDRIVRRRRNVNSVVMLTPIGGRKADEYMHEDVMGKIFMYLQDHGASNVSDIARGIGVESHRCFRIIDSMVRRQYLQYSNID